MRCSAIVCFLLFLCGSAQSQHPPSPPAQPSQFEIGRRTFFDFGPPFDFYEIFIVRPYANGTSVERITLTPAAQECVVPAKVERAYGSIPESASALLGAENPCAIPEKALRHELKRCKKCLVFSGSDVVMRDQCGSETRLIHTNVLEKDWFETSPHTPEHTSWTIQLLARLDHAVGPEVMEKPTFPLPAKDEEQANNVPDSPTVRDVSTGKYDALFLGAPNNRPAWFGLLRTFRILQLFGCLSVVCRCHRELLLCPSIRPSQD